MKSVDVVIPCFNGEDFLDRAISSVLDQTVPVNRIIVVNDGSTDKSQFILEEYQRKFPNVVVISQTNRGLANARNVGIRFSTANYIALLDCDDYWSPVKIENQLAAVREDSEQVAIVSKYFNLYGGKLSDGKVPSKRLKLNQRNLLLQLVFLPGSGSSVLISRESIDRLGTQIFSEDLTFAEDLDCWIRLAALGEIEIIDHADVIINVRDNGMQGSVSVNPMPYLVSQLMILRKYQHVLGRSLAFLHKYFIFFQVLKRHSFFGKTRIDLKQLKFQIVRTRIPQKLTYIRLICVFTMPVYYLLRKFLSMNI